MCLFRRNKIDKAFDTVDKVIRRGGKALNKGATIFGRTLKRSAKATEDIVNDVKTIKDNFKRKTNKRG